MSLKDIAAAIEGQMRLIEPTLTPPFDFGADKLTTEHDEPVIILVPTGEIISGPVGQGGDFRRNPRPLWTRHVSIVAHIWACDVPAVELLLNALVQAMQVVMWGPYKLISGQWSTAADMVTRWGTVYALAMHWEVPITDQPATFAQVNSMPLDPLVVVTS